MRQRFRYFIFVFMYFSCSVIYAGNSGVAFLKIPVSARASAMGQASASLMEGIFSVVSNPAGLAQIQSSEVSLTHSELFAETRLNFVGYGHPLKAVTDNNGKAVATESKGKMALGVGMVYLSQGEIEGRGANREPIGNFSASDFAMAFSFARTLKQGMHFGSNLKIIQERLGDETAVGFALDMGVIMPTALKSLTLAGIVQNLGPKMKFMNESFSLPLVMKMGARYQLVKWVSLSSDVGYYPEEKDSTISFGAEMNPAQNISLRTGYLPISFSRSKSASSFRSGQSGMMESFSGFSTGIGLKISRYEMDYAFIPFGELGNNHQISFTARF